MKTMNDEAPLRFSLIGSLRSGSSLLSRCLDDHPHAICLCESEISRTLFPGYFHTLHFQRMRSHGLSDDEILRLLDGKKPDDLAGYEAWHDHAFRLLKARYEKPGARAIGDKSPDFYRSRILVDHLRASHRLIYTVRNPRAIHFSIETDDTEQFKKERRWTEFLDNVEIWLPYLDEPNILVVRYEDFVTNPIGEMERIHRHLGLDPSEAFLAPGARKFPRRFLWSSNVDPVAGDVRPIDPSRSSKWRGEADAERLVSILSNEIVRSYCGRFGYE